MPGLTCRQCGNRISEKSLYPYCLKCGTPTAASMAGQSVDHPARGTEVTPFCANCAAALSPQASFCHKCGYRVGSIPNSTAPTTPPPALAWVPPSSMPSAPGIRPTRKALITLGAFGLLAYVLIVMGPGAAQQAAREAGVPSTRTSNSPAAAAATAPRACGMTPFAMKRNVSCSGGFVANAATSTGTGNDLGAPRA